MKRAATVIPALLLWALPSFAQEGVISIVDIAQAYSEGKYKKVCDETSRLIASGVADDAMLYYFAVSSQRLGNLEAAKTAIDTALSINPDNLDIMEAAFNIAIESQDDALATTYCETLVEKAPNIYTSPFSLSLLGKKALGEHRDSAALAYFDQALEMDPDYATAHIGKFELCFNSGKYQEAFNQMNLIVTNPTLPTGFICDVVHNLLQFVDGAFFRRWRVQLDYLAMTPAVMNPSSIEALELAGNWYYATARKDKALEYYTTLSNLNPADFGCRAQKMMFFFLEKRYDETIAECLDILGKCTLHENDHANVLSTMGDTYYEIGNYNEAFKTYDKAIKIKKDDPYLLNNYAYYLSEQDKNLRKAERLAKYALELKEEDSSILDTYGWILFKLKRYDQAKVYLKKALIYGDGDHIATLEHLEAVYEALGDKDLANYYRMSANSKKEKK